MNVDHTTKLVVFASMTAALVIEAVLMARGWPAILPLTIGALAISCAVSLRFAEPAAAFVLLFTYTFPAIVRAWHGQFEFGYMTVWVAALLGVMLPGLRRGWAVPARWRLPLILWALTVAFAWPVVALREIDLVPMTLEVARLSVTGPPGVAPLNAILWILNVTLVLGTGILWFDWLFANFDDAERRFRIVVGALAASWLVTTSVAIYQLVFDVTFLNSGSFGSLQRASGLMLDANPFGVIAAIGIPVVAAVALRAPFTGRSATVLAVTGLGWAALWASGSRTALAAGIIGTTFALYYWGDSVLRRSGVTRRVVVTGMFVVLAAILVPILLQRLTVVGSWRRLAASLPRLSLVELWNRDGYGLAATRMIRDFPGFGVGVGAFHYLVIDYSRALLGGAWIPFDNAQNWYRHQLAEFGIVGSVGWILWTLSFGWFVIATRVAAPARWAAGAIRGALVAIALVSLLGMPTQNLAVTITFWTLAFWFTVLAREQTPASAARDGIPTRVPISVWIAIWLLAAISAAGTAYSGRHDLRVPMRAATFGWPYSYGFSDPETGPNGQFRWAAQRAVTVIDAPKPWMKVTVSVDHLNIARQPVEVRVSGDGHEVLRTTLATVQPVTEYVRVPDGRRRIVLETWVSHTVRPTDFGIPDPRDLGVMVQWEFVDAR